MTLLDLLSELINITPELEQLLLTNLKLPSDALVILETNRGALDTDCSPLAGVNLEGTYIPESTYWGTVSELNEEDILNYIEEGYTTEQINQIQNQPKCIELYPIR